MVSPGRMRAVRRFVIVAMMAGLVLVPTVQAKQYTNGQNHYRLVVPDAWTEQQVSGVDVAFVGPADPVFSPSLNVVTAIAGDAANTSSWLLAQAQGAYDGVSTALPDATEVQAPRTFVTDEGRLAADYVLDYNLTSNWAWVRLRQVILVSDFWDRGYILSFAAMRPNYDAWEPVWSQAVDSFEVMGEGQAGGMDLTPILVVVVAVAVVAVGLLVWARRRKATRPPVPPIAPPPPMPPVPPIPPPTEPPGP